MEKWARIKYQPCLPLGDNGSKITGCQKHIALSREAAGEGIVLLKNNDKILPLAKGTKVAIFGKAQIDYVKGGGGSGDVHSAYVRNIYEGLKLSEKVEIFDALSLFYQEQVLAAYKNGEQPSMLTEPGVPEELLAKARAFTDTAIITINRYSSEFWDRMGDGSDPYFELSLGEKEMVASVCDSFAKVIVLLNTGAMIDTAWFEVSDKISGEYGHRSQRWAWVL